MWLQLPAKGERYIRAQHTAAWAAVMGSRETKRAGVGRSLPKPCSPAPPTPLALVILPGWEPAFRALPDLSLSNNSWQLCGPGHAISVSITSIGRDETAARGYSAVKSDGVCSARGAAGVQCARDVLKHCSGHRHCIRSSCNSEEVAGR